MENHIQRLCQVEIFHGNLPTKDPVDLSMWVKYGHISLSNYNQPVVLVLRILYYGHYSFLGNIFAPDYFIADKA